MIRRFELRQEGSDYIGEVTVDCSDMGLVPAGWREIIKYADTDKTFTFEHGSDTYHGVSIHEIKET